MTAASIAKLCSCYPSAPIPFERGALDFPAPESRSDTISHGLRSGLDEGNSTNSDAQSRTRIARLSWDHGYRMLQQVPVHREQATVLWSYPDSVDRLGLSAPALG